MCIVYTYIYIYIYMIDSQRGSTQSPYPCIEISSTRLNTQANMRTSHACMHVCMWACMQHACMPTAA